MRKSKKKLRHRQISPTLSSEIVNYLWQSGMTLKRIGSLIGELSESFICRVGSGHRNFTIEHLLKLQEALQQPLPLLLIAANKKASRTREMRNFYPPLRRDLKSFGPLEDLTLSVRERTAG